MKLSELGTALDPRKPLRSVYGNGAAQPVSSAGGGVDPLRHRAAASLELFTGASIGVVLALWRQERAQLKAQLASVGAIDSGFELLDRAFNATTALALSPAAAAALGTRTALHDLRMQAGFARRSEWESGVAWLPGRRVLAAWAGDGDQLQLFEISAVNLERWVRGLSTAEPTPLSWIRWVIPADAELSTAHSWHGLAADITALMLLGQPSPTLDNGSLPATRYVITLAESRTGVPPMAFAGGGAPARQNWVGAGFREVWSAPQNRYVRKWTDAYSTDSQRPPNEPILLTVLPQR